MNKLKIAVGLSGGVDSAVTAAILKEQGWMVSGVFMECWKEPGCRTDQDRKDALAVALKLEIPFEVVDFRKEYRQQVMRYFWMEYKKGRTPNPDVICNQKIKFGLLWSWAKKNGFERLATGHYALVKKERLFSAKDVKKDQTYFLAMLKKRQLEKVMFPLGNLLKIKVRQIAKKKGLPVWNKKDSTGVCLVNEDYDFREFLKRKIKEHKGEVVDMYGQIIGDHQGVEFFTIGQRHGFRIDHNWPKMKPLYVLKKEIEKNRLVVGERKALGKNKFRVEKWSWIDKGPKKGEKRLRVRIRHQGKLVEATIMGPEVRLREKVYGLAPGQVAAVYRQTERTAPSVFECLGGGIIE